MRWCNDGREDDVDGVGGGLFFFLFGNGVTECRSYRY